MRIPIDRRIKITLLRWLRQGYVDTTDLPEAYSDGNTLFAELLKVTSADGYERERQAEAEPQDGKADAASV